MGENMIKAENGTILLKGYAELLEIELSSIIKAFYSQLSKATDKEFAKERIKIAYEVAMSERKGEEQWQ